MAVEKANSDVTNQRIPQPEQVEVALSGVVDALVHHGSCQCVTILVLIVVQWKEPAPVARTLKNNLSQNFGG